MKQIEALKQFLARENHTEVPPGHIEIVDSKEVKLGSWLTSTRQKYRNGTLSREMIAECEAVSPGFSWTKRKTGPKVRNSARDLNIFALHSAGMSLEKIAEQYDVSRQRIHQVVKKVQSTV